MKRRGKYTSLIPMYIISLCILLAVGFYSDRAITALSEHAPLKRASTVIIDAGHGGVDGGATSCTGILESSLNLEIALKLNDLMHLLGLNTVMIRTTDTSVHTSGSSIAQIKVSDLKERVRIVNECDNAILVSIHQNYFSDSRYSGAQVFYAPSGSSKDLAAQLQQSILRSLNPGSTRQIKKADGIYLMQHIDCTGVLIECGFLSNPTEEAHLRDDSYQRKLCCVIASTLSCHLAA